MWRHGPHARVGIRKAERRLKSQPARQYGSVQARQSKMPSMSRSGLPARSPRPQRNPRCGSKTFSRSAVCGGTGRGSAFEPRSRTALFRAREIMAGGLRLFRAGREEFWVEHLEPIQTELVRQISRVLHILFLHDVSYRASMTSDAELGVTECLARAVNALKGKLCAEFSAEAQQWFLAALACDPRNVEALVGLALTCQHLASNPWWGDPLGAAAASDLGREAVAVALELQPGHALAHCVQGMLYSAVGELEQAEAAFRLTLAIDPGLGSAHAFLGYNRALLGNAGETLPAIERAMRLDPTDRHHSIWLFFGGFAELLVGQTEAAIALFRRSLARNPTYGSAELFLIVALSLIGRHRDAVLIAESFRQQYSESPVDAFERLWLSRSASPVYRAQVFPLFEKIQMLSAAA